MTLASPESLIELHCAAQPFLRRRTLKEVEARERLRRAIRQVLHERDLELPPNCVADAGDALELLRVLVHRCVEMKVRWDEVVAIVNREAREP